MGDFDCCINGEHDEHNGFDHCAGCQAEYQAKEAAKDAG